MRTCATGDGHIRGDVHIAGRCCRKFRAIVFEQLNASAAAAATSATSDDDNDDNDEVEATETSAVSTAGRFRW